MGAFDHATLEAHLNQVISTRLALHRLHFARAREWLASFKLPLRTLDALQVAVAAAEGAMVMTADGALAEARAKVGVKARLITIRG